jgi:hypothetical protein
MNDGIHAPAIFTLMEAAPGVFLTRGWAFLLKDFFNHEKHTASNGLSISKNMEGTAVVYLK